MYRTWHPNAYADGRKCFTYARERLMEIIVFGKRFGCGSWEDWEHTCSEEEVHWTHDSALAKAQDRSHFGPPLPIDYLKGARFIFDVAYGPKDNPRDGDIRVHGVSVNGARAGIFELPKATRTCRTRRT